VDKGVPSVPGYPAVSLYEVNHSYKQNQPGTGRTIGTRSQFKGLQREARRNCCGTGAGTDSARRSRKCAIPLYIATSKIAESRRNSSNHVKTRLRHTGLNKELFAAHEPSAVFRTARRCNVPTRENAGVPGSRTPRIVPRGQRTGCDDLYLHPRCILK
jgi:hypothetical protein